MKRVGIIGSGDMGSGIARLAVAADNADALHSRSLGSFLAEGGVEVTVEEV